MISPNTTLALEGISNMGEAVRIVRLARKWTQDQLAHLARCSQADISYLELNRRCKPELEARVCDILGIEFSEDGDQSEGE